MIRDNSLTLSNMQAITATAVSANAAAQPVVIDFGAVGTALNHKKPLRRNVGIGACVPFLIQVTETFAAAGAATLNVQMQFSVDEAFTTPVIAWQSGAIPVADLVAGANLGVVNSIPKGVLDRGGTLRFFRMNYIVATGPFTAGKITAAVVGAVQTNPLSV